MAPIKTTTSSAASMHRPYSTPFPIRSAERTRDFTLPGRAPASLMPGLMAQSVSEQVLSAARFHEIFTWVFTISTQLDAERAQCCGWLKNPTSILGGNLTPKSLPIVAVTALITGLTACLTAGFAVSPAGASAAALTGAGSTLSL